MMTNAVNQLDIRRIIDWPKNNGPRAGNRKLRFYDIRNKVLEI